MGSKFPLNPDYCSYFACLSIDDSGEDSDSDSDSNSESEKTLPSSEAFVELNRFCKNSVVFYYPESGSPISYHKLPKTGYEVRDATEIINFALPYLGLKDLLSVESVCKDLRREVLDNTLLWRKICIEPPMNMPDNDVLEKLIARAQGSLECLTLVQNFKVDNRVLIRVLLSNPKLRKLKVPSCRAIDLNILASILKILKSEGRLQLEVLRVSGIFGATKINFEAFKYAISSGSLISNQKPVYFGFSKPFLLCNDGYDERAIDIDLCPKCEKPGSVYDCPLKSCQQKTNQNGQSACRGCLRCIYRCSACGRCLDDCVYTEFFSLEFYCDTCYEQYKKASGFFL